MMALRLPLRVSSGAVAAVLATGAGLLACGSGAIDGDRLADGDGGLVLDGGVDGGGDGGGGLDAPTGDTGGGADAGNKCDKTLTGILRDFKDDHPDFEQELGDDRGIVAATLGADGKPVYAGGSGTTTTHGKTAFDQWYRDVAGVNQSSTFAITMTPGPGGVFTFSSNAFFPLDGKGFGNQGRDHNFHFTYELRTTFLYKGGEVFKFTGDDDLFTFINGRLVIDLGGVHGAQDATVDLDARAAELKIEKGKVYSLDFFFAERHTSESNFRIDTTLNFVDCGTGIK